MNLYQYMKVSYFLLYLSLSLCRVKSKGFLLIIQLADDLSFTELYIVASGLPLNVIVTNVSQCNCIALRDIWLEDSYILNLNIVVVFNLVDAPMQFN
jgi:hypothetical protein